MIMALEGLSFREAKLWEVPVKQFFSHMTPQRCLIFLKIKSYVLHPIFTLKALGGKKTLVSVFHITLTVFIQLYDRRFHI